jgi:hypothetical protein
MTLTARITTADEEDIRESSIKIGTALTDPTHFEPIPRDG